MASADIKNYKSSGDGGVRYSINREFATEYDNWDKTNFKKVFVIGTTSDVLQKIGVENRTITWDGSKILKILEKHSEMSDDIIKQVPNILEEPIIVMKSKSSKNRITMFGEVYYNNKPIFAVLELSPNNKNGLKIDEIKVASSYAKDNAKNFIDTSEVLYLESNKKRVNTFETLTGLQLPVGGVNSNNSIPNSTENVKDNVATDSEGNKLSKGQQEFFKDSKVRDEDGNLLVVYHGTDYYNPITVFKKGKSGYLGGE